SRASRPRPCAARRAFIGARAMARKRASSPRKRERGSCTPASAVRLLLQPVLSQLLAQRGAVDAEHGRGAALVAVAMVQHFDEQRDLELAQRDLVEVVGMAAVE